MWSARSGLIEPAHLVAGEKVEVLSDSVAGYPLRYARTIHVIQPVPPPRPQSLGRLRAYDPKSEPAIRAGNITYSGVVFRLNSQRVMLHTREVRRTHHPAAQGHALPGRRTTGGRWFAETQHAGLCAGGQGSL